MHFLTASIAIAGLFLALLWYFRRQKDEETARARIRTGLRVFGYASLVQVVIGIWFLLSQPRDIMMLFMGQGTLHTIALILGILTALMAIYFAFTGKLMLTLYHLLATVVLMVGMRALLRAAYLNDYHDPGELVLAPQNSVLILFLIVFVIGLISVNYMVRAAVKANDRGTRV